MFSSVKDWKDYIKQTIKSTKATTAPSQASIWRVHNGKFQPVGNTHTNGPGGLGTVIWKMEFRTTHSTNCTKIQS